MLSYTFKRITAHLNNYIFMLLNINFFLKNIISFVCNSLVGSRDKRTDGLGVVVTKSVRFEGRVGALVVRVAAVGTRLFAVSVEQVVVRRTVRHVTASHRHRLRAHVAPPLVVLQHAYTTPPLAVRQRTYITPSLVLQYAYTTSPLVLLQRTYITPLLVLQYAYTTPPLVVLQRMYITPSLVLQHAYTTPLYQMSNGKEVDIMNC